METRLAALESKLTLPKMRLKQGVPAAALLRVGHLTEHFQVVVSQWFRFSVKGKGRKHAFGSKPAILSSTPNAVTADWTDKSLTCFRVYVTWPTRQ